MGSKTGSKEVGLKVESVYRDEQSRWIVAVAESRDKKAFKQLFNYFAPRIKGFARTTVLRPTEQRRWCRKPS